MVECALMDSTTTNANAQLVSQATTANLTSTIAPLIHASTGVNVSMASTPTSVNVFQITLETIARSRLPQPRLHKSQKKPGLSLVLPRRAISIITIITITITTIMDTSMCSHAMEVIFSS